jgi:enoyl-CoA hydratase/carnithine racemase
MAVIKSQVYRHLQMDLADSLAESNQVMRESLESPDFREGVASFVERRPPAFQQLRDHAPLAVPGT